MAPLPAYALFWDGVEPSQSLIGVLDLDAINLNGFDEVDQKGLEKLAQCLIDGSDWPEW